MDNKDFKTKEMKNNLLSLINNRNTDKEVRLIGIMRALNERLITYSKAESLFQELNTFSNYDSLIHDFNQELENEEKSFKPDFAIPPSETLQEIMDNKGLTLSDLSELSNIPLHHLKGIMESKVEICEVSAPKIANVLDVEESFLLNLENNYRQNLGRLQDLKNNMDANNSLTKRETQLTKIALEHYVECDIDDIERIEMNKLIEKINNKQ